VIVADSNVLAYLWLPGEHTRAARAVWDRDPDWHVPVLWRAEMRSILVGFLRCKSMHVADIVMAMTAMEKSLRHSEHHVDSSAVFDAAQRSSCSAYDCEFVALADALAAPLVTEDRQILAAFPQRAVRMADFVAHQSHGK
jgi:predicted nucleic acid-binding protein